jgi:hypothetical protein
LRKMNLPKDVLLIFFVLTCVLISGCAYSQNQTPATNESPSINTTSVISKSPQIMQGKLPPEAAGMENVVLKADLIVIGEITAQKYETISEKLGKMTYTLYTLTIEKTIKGDPDIKEVFIKVSGGKNGDFIAIQMSGPVLAITDKTLICLKNESDKTYYSSFSFSKDSGDVQRIGESDGTLWINSKVNGISSGNSLDKVLGWVILVMKKNDIPIVLPEKDRPFLPGAPTNRPK